MSELRRRFGEALLTLYLTVAPSSVPAWRLDPNPRIAAVLMVGDPTPSLGYRRAALPVTSPE